MPVLYLLSNFMAASPPFLPPVKSAVSVAGVAGVAANADSGTSDSTMHRLRRPASSFAFVDVIFILLLSTAFRCVYIIDFHN